MANLDQSKWFTEISDRDGSAFSLRINKKLDEKQSPFQKVEMFETTAAVANVTQCAFPYMATC